MPALRPTCGRRLTHARERLGAPACANYTGVETPQIKALEWAFGVDLTTIYWTSEIVTHNKLWPRRLWLRARLHRRRVTRPHAPAQRRSPADGPSVTPGSAGTQKCDGRRARVARPHNSDSLRAILWGPVVDTIARVVPNTTTPLIDSDAVRNPSSGLEPDSCEQELSPIQSPAVAYRPGWLWHAGHSFCPLYGGITANWYK